MKLTTVITAVLVGFVLAGCQHQLTLEEARALCTKQGGFLVVIHSQKITMAGLGEEKDSPGNCISPDKFGTSPPAPSPAAKPAN